MLEFVLFAILGWCVFHGVGEGTNKIILLVIFVVLMLLWFIGVIGMFPAAWHDPLMGRSLR